MRDAGPWPSLTGLFLGLWIVTLAFFIPLALNAKDEKPDTTRYVETFEGMKSQEAAKWAIRYWAASYDTKVYEKTIKCLPGHPSGLTCFFKADTIDPDLINEHPPKGF